MSKHHETSTNSPSGPLFPQLDTWSAWPWPWRHRSPHGPGRLPQNRSQTDGFLLCFWRVFFDETCLMSCQLLKFDWVVWILEHNHFPQKQLVLSFKWIEGRNIGDPTLCCCSLCQPKRLSYNIKIHWSCNHFCSISQHTQAMPERKGSSTSQMLLPHKATRGALGPTMGLFCHSFWAFLNTPTTVGIKLLNTKMPTKCCNVNNHNGLSENHSKHISKYIPHILIYFPRSCCSKSTLGLATERKKNELPMPSTNSSANRAKCPADSTCSSPNGETKNIKKKMKIMSYLKFLFDFFVHACLLIFDV